MQSDLEYYHQTIEPPWW